MSLASNVSPATRPFEQALQCDLTPVDAILGRSASLVAGAFRCPAVHPTFAGSGPLQCHYVVFPRNTVEIRRDDEPRFISSVGTMNLYSCGDSYRRRRVREAFDRCDYLAVPRATLDALASAALPVSLFDQDEGRFRRSHVPIEARAFLQQRSLFERLEAGALEDGLALEEAALPLLAALLRSDPERRHATGPRARCGAGRDARQREAVERAREFVSVHAFVGCTLEQVGAAAHMSACHIARAFRCATGYTLHGFQLQLRLRASLEQLPDYRGNLGALAHRLGFSHHSHFTNQFRRVFGLSPSRYQRLQERSGRAARRRAVDTLAQWPQSTGT